MRATAAATPLLTRPEQLLYGRLVRAFPGHIILSHMALSRLLTAGFVVCRSDFTPLAVFEIDEAAADAAAHVARRDRNRRKDKSLQAAGIKVIRLPVGDLPDEPALRALAAAHPLHSLTEQLVRRAS
jgi:uncharacterized protein (DUF58 family)